MNLFRLLMKMVEYVNDVEQFGKYIYILRVALLAKQIHTNFCFSEYMDGMGSFVLFCWYNLVSTRRYVIKIYFENMLEIVFLWNISRSAWIYNFKLLLMHIHTRPYFIMKLYMNAWFASVKLNVKHLNPLPKHSKQFHIVQNSWHTMAKL